MRGLVIVGALLIIFGIAVLVNQGMNFSTTKKSVELGSVQISEKQRHHISPAFGVVAVVAGVALVLLEKKR
jgi:uncharacterized membrane protein YidH (DUF202 family)